MLRSQFPIWARCLVGVVWVSIHGAFAAAQIIGEPTPATRPTSLPTTSSGPVTPRRGGPATLRTGGDRTAAPTSPMATATQLLAEAYERTQKAATLDDYHVIVDVCERVLATKPAPEVDAYAKQLAAWAYNRRGEIDAEQAVQALKQGDVAKASELDALALEDFKAAVAYEPTRWKALHNLAVSRAQHGQLKAAIADFDRVIALKGDFTNAWFNRAEIHNQLGDYARAVADYDQSLALSPKDLGALQGRSRAHFQLKQYARALADINLVLRGKPDDAAALADRADIQAALSQWQQATDDYRSAIAANPKLGRAHRRLAWLLATCPDERFRNADQALLSAEKAMETEGEDHQTLDTLAAAYANAGRYPEARSTLEKAIEIAPRNQAEVMLERLHLYSASKPYRLATEVASARTTTTR